MPWKFPFLRPAFTMMTSPLPASFTSLYRLFLRLSSASVLHYRPAKLNLIARYRPAFEEAAKLTALVETAGSEKLDPIAVKALRTWHERSMLYFSPCISRSDSSTPVDNTLSLLLSSAQSRGLPHHLTYNLAFLLAQRRKRSIQDFRMRPRWNPQDAEPKVPKPKTARAKEKEDALNKLQHDLDMALAQATALAEGYSGIILGDNNVPLKKKRCMFYLLSSVPHPEFL